MKEMSLLDLVTLVSALACGVNEGAFFAF